MIYFIGAGPGDPDLITVKGRRLLEQADLVIYAGSLVSREHLSFCRKEARCLDSAGMTLEQVIAEMADMPEEAVVVRLHTGDPSIYGAIREQIERLDELGIEWKIVPGVSSFCGAAAALGTEYTIPGGSQTVILTRRAGRTPVPDEESIGRLAVHGSTMVFFLSAGMLDEVCQELIEGGYPPETPAAVVFRASWPDEQIVRGTLATLPQLAGAFSGQAIITVGEFLTTRKERSLLYDPAFSHGCRGATE